jgi:hypothetical protein
MKYLLYKSVDSLFQMNVSESGRRKCFCGIRNVKLTININRQYDLGMLGDCAGQARILLRGFGQNDIDSNHRSLIQNVKQVCIIGSSYGPPSQLGKRFFVYGGNYDTVVVLPFASESEGEIITTIIDAFQQSGVLKKQYGSDKHQKEADKTYLVVIFNYKKERGVVKLLKVRLGGQKGRIRPAPSGLSHLQAESPVCFVKALPSHHLCSAEAGQAKT